MKNAITFFFLLNFLAVCTFSTSLEKDQIQKSSDSGREKLPKSFVPDFPLKTVRFMPNTTWNESTTCEHKNIWDDLLPPGSGLVVIPNPEKYSYGPGLSSTCGADRYSLAVFHQLHCLYIIRRSVFQLAQANDTKTYQHAQSQLYHTKHCFDYLRQSIQCSADTTVEATNLEENAGHAVEGWNVEHRQCRDYDAILKWVQNNTCAGQEDEKPIGHGCAPHK